MTFKNICVGLIQKLFYDTNGEVDKPVLVSVIRTEHKHTRGGKGMDLAHIKECVQGNKPTFFSKPGLIIM